MSASSISEYQDHPIFLHFVNRELHDALGRDADKTALLMAIRMFSVLSGQTLFCNVSQVHELFYDSPEALTELTELAKSGRFIAHSDYGSFEEFRESRQEHFTHSILNHPGFIETPSRELLRLPHGSMGVGVSTTKDIERRLGLWLEEKPESSLRTTLSENDQVRLRSSEDWIQRTLQERDQKALTFDAFERTAAEAFARSSEGAIRRSLTEAYIEGYIETYSAHCLWGFAGINHFEKFRLLAGLNVELASAVIRETGLHDHLRRSRGYGIVKRLTSETSDEIAYLRQSYFELSSGLDSFLGERQAWHICNARVRSQIHQLKQSGVLKPPGSASSFSDLLLRAAEALQRAKSSESSSTRHIQPLIGLERGSQVPPRAADPSLPKEALEASDEGAPQKESWWKTYSFVVVAGAVLIGFVAFLVLIVFFKGSLFEFLLVSAISALFGGALIIWFHPDNWYRRMAWFGIGTSGLGGLSYRFQYVAQTDEGSGSMQIGGFPSELLVIGGLIVTVISIVADLLHRKWSSR